MKVYLAGRFDERERIRKMQELLRQHGHEITVDWTTHTPLARYGDEPELARRYAEEDVRGVAEAEAFIFLTSPSVGTGTHVELGVAIRQCQLQGRPRIFVIGEHTTRSIMYFHPTVERRADLEAVLVELADA